MPTSEVKFSEQKRLPGIFISYRRSDSPDAVGRIYDRLIAEFGKARVFKDVDSIPLGQDFRGHLNEIVGGCAAVLAIIGPKWTDIRNEAGQKRLEDPDDFVRIELEAALARNVPVVPVLVGHAPMPGTSQLPSSLASMAFRQSIEVRPDPDFHNDATRLVVALRQIIDPNSPQVEASSGKPKRSWVPWLVGLASALTLAVLALAVPALKHLREAPPPETRLDIVTPTTDQPTSFALSPDGRQIMFVASTDGVSRLWLRSLATTTAQPLPGTEGATDPFWSPDSRSIGFFTADSLQRLDLGGGVPQVLATVILGRGATWNADNVIVFAPAGFGPLMRVSATGGKAVAVTKLGPRQGAHLWPHFLPDGRHLLFDVQGAGDTTGLYLGSLDGKVPTRLTTSDSRSAFLPSGWMLWLQGGALVAQRLDLQKSALIGQPITVADGVRAVSVAATGLVAFRAGVAQPQQLQWVDRLGEALGTIGDKDFTYSGPRVSPDGSRVAVSRTIRGNQDLWVLDGSRMTRVTTDAASEDVPIWSPDGTRIAYRSNQSGRGGLFEKLASGAGEAKRLLVSDEPLVPNSWSPDASSLLYMRVDPLANADLYILPMAGNAVPAVFLKTSLREAWGAFSPDGRWVAYHSNESGRSEVYLQRFVLPAATSTVAEPVGKRWQVSAMGGIHPAWRPDGRELYFLNPAGEMMAALITVNGSSLEIGTPKVLFQSQILLGGIDRAQARQYDVAPDGRFLINRRLNAGETPPITLIQNWNPDATRQ